MTLTALLALLLPGIAAGENPEDRGYLARPMWSAAGVVCTNSFSSALYVAADDSLRELVAGPGVGQYYTVSPSGTLVGFKEIGADGLQCPAVMDPRTGDVRRLAGPARRVGQVSFTNDGRTGFTIDMDLIITDGVTTQTHALGTYANLAPLSPDGTFAVFNDADDQLWLLNLSSQSRRCITDGTAGFFAPVWAPAGNRVVYSSLHGLLSVYDLGSKRTFPLGRGSHPLWTPDSRTIVFDRTTVDRNIVVASDLMQIRFDGTGEQRLACSPGSVAMDPCVTPDGTGVLYHTAAGREIRWQPMNNSSPVTEQAGSVRARGIALTFTPQAPTSAAVTALDIPYVHQVYDTPDWFNGHWACAPTQAIMVLAFYQLLPPWPIICTWPTAHVTPWGNYVAEQYRFLGTDYAFAAADPNGVNGRGGYGFMWTGASSPHTRMADYFRSHGLTATQTEGTAYSTAASEIAAGYPLSMCVLLTTSGHLVLAHGFGAEQHTLVFNDPYGNKNQGYVNGAGKNVMYDWPGYNNGYQNLNQVAWCIATRYAAPPVADTLVDDLDFAHGFSLATAPPASMTTWRDLVRGHQGHLWYALSSAGPIDTFFAEWRPTLSAAGDYDVQAFIELSNATDARYEITHAAGRDSVPVNQKSYSKAWVSLGIYPFAEGSTGAVRLSHLSGSAGQEMVFDAIRWVRVVHTAAAPDRDAGSVQEFRLEQNYPNPFNPSTQLRFVLPREATVRLEILNTLGQRVAMLHDGAADPGVHVYDWIPNGLASGIYLARLRAMEDGGTTRQAVIKMMVTR
jgi:hypothetical protein